MKGEWGHIDEGLLLKYHQQQTTNAESADVQQWLSDAPENSLEYEELIKIWTAIGSNARSISVDVDAAWSKLSKKIEAYDVIENEPAVRRLSRPKFTWLAAASVVALVGLFTVFQYFFSNKEMQVASKQTLLEQQLSDGSSIALNKNSKLWYPKKFKGDTREVKLEGEAFFDIERDESKPFIIEAGIGEVKVLGTSFNVEAYEGQDLRVQVVTGRVQLSLPNETADSNKVILEAGNTGVINRATGKVYKENQDYEDALFWLNKRLVFDKTPLPKVFEVLEKNYGIRFSNGEKDVSKCMLTARFENESIDDILSVIEATFNVRFEINEGRIQVTSEDQNCGEDI